MDHFDGIRKDHPFPEHGTIKTKVIVNPDSKPRRIKKYLRPALAVLKNSGFETSVFFTRGPGEVQEIARTAASEGYDALITAGGDGTCNEAINGIVGFPIPLGILPFGGSNVLGREIGVPLHPVRAAELIARRRIRKIDLGLINGRYFSMMAGCGYDAYAISRTSRKIKKIIHRYAYLWAGLKDFIGYRPTEITVTVDGGRIVETGTFAVISNSHYYGGSHQMALYAKIDDGYLDLCVYQGKYQIGLARFAFNILVKNHLSMKNVKYHRVKEVEIRAAKRTMVQVDGDLLGELPMTARIVPQAIEVFS